MNEKTAKRLRREAKQLMLEYVKARVLSPEQCEGESDERLISTLPERMLLQKDRTKTQAFGTKRFFVRILKKYPNITYQELDDFVYNK